MNNNLQDHLISFRRELHQYPELSQKEFQTQKRIIRFLEGIGIDNAISVGNTGVMVVFEGKETGKTVLIRADTDALPITEINDFEYRSSIEGVSHKCGHDGHTAIIAGVAKHLVDHPLKKGKAILLFQPAEENGEGAKAVLDDDNFSYKPDFVFALHNLPGYKKHTIVVKSGSFTAAVCSIIVLFNGKTSHAAEPESGINPARAISELIEFFENSQQPDLDSDDFALTAPVYIQMGEKSYGVTAGHGEIHYTLRSWTNSTLEEMKMKSVGAAEEIATKYNLELEIEWKEEFAANQNNPEVVSMIEHTAHDLGLSVERRVTPFKWGEDFGLFTERFKGAMFGIGAGEDCPALHNPDYDFPDDLIPSGISMFTQLISKAVAS